ncbi:MAG: hypothetical protein QHH06_07595 [Clostridiales bacterium]|jgi:hypothetical protein|nr:hypothetical protein [Eubacteriales bacterium]MDH7566331.1 hypothetical protein [Clostridiales bacterium]
MSDFALVICPRENPELLKKDFFQKIFSSIFHLLKKKPEPAGLTRKVEIDENLGVYVITLPYTINQLKKLKEKKLKATGMLISGICVQNRAEDCFLPQQVRDICLFEGCKYNPYKGKFLYRSLLPNLLSQISHKRGMKTGDVDIAVVQGESHEELNAVLWLISPHIKYVTVVVNDKKAVETMLEQLYSETGLSVGVTEDYAAGMKDADFIINLGGLRSSPPYPKMAPSAVVLNCGERDITDLPSNNIIVNGIQVNLPSNILFQFDKGIYEYFSKQELSEILLLHRLGIRQETPGIYGSHEAMRKISEEFVKCGFKVTGFAGRHGYLKMEDMETLR